MAGLRFARYDRGFVDDERFLALPPRHRANAYLLLLAINGHTYERGWRHPPANGVVSWPDIVMLAYKCGFTPRTARVLIDALIGQELVRHQGTSFFLPRFFKWNPELSREYVEARREDGRRGAEARWAHGVGHGVPDSRPNSPAHGVPDSLPHARQRHRRRSTTSVLPSSETSSLQTPSTPSTGLSGVNGLTPDLVQILSAYEAETTCAPTARDITAAHQVLELCQRLEVARIVAEIPGAVAWVREKGGQVRSLGQLYGWMERLNTSLADAKAPLALRFQASERGGEMTSIGESL